MSTVGLTWMISAGTVIGVILRPFRVSEWIFAVAGAVLLLVIGLLPLGEAASAVAGGLDVYLFLTGMMLLSEVARREGLFDALAARAVTFSRGSPVRLFTLVYLIGTVVTVFLSNDATAVVLTPAVAAMARAAGVVEPMPYLFVCAFIANAASFVLPISNPANLVIFGENMPSLGDWLSRFTLPSIAAILATYVALRWTQRDSLNGAIETAMDPEPLGTSGRIAAGGIIIGAIVLVGASALGRDLGWPTAGVGIATLAAVLVVERKSPLPVLGGISWGVLPLVAGLFVVVRALDRTGLNEILSAELERWANQLPELGPALVGTLLAFATNLTNNLPLGLLAGEVVQNASVPEKMVDAVLIGVDLGPNLSVTGSLATILWLTALKREGLQIGALAFLRLGAVVMIPALVLALASLTFQPWGG